MKKIIKPLFAAALALLFISCASAPAPVRPAALSSNEESALAYLDTYVASQMAKRKIVGLTLALVDGQRTVLAKGYGLADKNKKIPTTSETRFNIGSVSKLFTCAGIMKLVEQGKIDLDAPITAYIPEFSIKTYDSSINGITIRRLLTHHSGMPSDYFKDFIFGDDPPPGYDTEFRNLVSAVKDLYVATPPDTVMSYSNLSYSLLAVVIERVSGLDFESFMQREIFAPIGMTDSSFLIDDPAQADYTRGYAGGKGMKVPAIRDIAAGALNTTARNLALFMSAMIASSNGSGGFLKRDTVREMWTVQNDGIPLDFGFTIGLTWWMFPIRELPDLPVVQHGGDLPPFHAFLAVAPGKGIGVAIAVNSLRGGSSFDLLDIATESLRTLIELKEGADPYSPAATPAPAAMPADLGQSLVGYYSGTLGFNQARYRNGRLQLKVSGLWFDAEYYPDASIALSLKLLGIMPIKIASFESIRLTVVTYDGRPWLAVGMSGVTAGLIEKIDPVPIPAVWLARAGKYVLANPEQAAVINSITLAYDKASGFLLARVGEGFPAQYVPLKPVSDLEAVTYGMGRSMNETIRIENPGPGETIAYSGLVFRKK